MDLLLAPHWKVGARRRSKRGTRRGRRRLGGRAVRGAGWGRTTLADRVTSGARGLRRRPGGEPGGGKGGGAGFGGDRRVERGRSVVSSSAGTRMGPAGDETTGPGGGVGGGAELEGAGVAWLAFCGAFGWSVDGLYVGGGGVAVVLWWGSRNGGWAGNAECAATGWMNPAGRGSGLAGGDGA